MTIFCIGSLAFILLYTSIFPTIQNQAHTIGAIFQATPRSFHTAFHIKDESFFTLPGFLSTEYLSFLWPILAILFTVSFAGGTIAGEIEKRIIGLSLSQPIARSSLFLLKYCTGILQLIIFLAFSIFSISLFATLGNFTYSFHNLIILLTLCILFTLCTLSIAFFISSLASERGKVYLTMGGLFVAMYVINIISSLKDSLDTLKYFSFFYYYDPQKAFVQGNIDHLTYIIFLSIGIIALIAGIVCFNKRDIHA